MEHKLRESKLSALSSRLNLMVLLVLGLLISNIILAYTSMYSMRHQKREVVPFGGNQGYIISETSVDVHYLNMMTENFIYARLNVTPRNVINNHNKLLTYTDSSNYAAIKKQLHKEAELIKSKKITSQFDINDVKSDNQRLVSEVTGKLKTYVGYRALKSQEKKYQINYQYRLGKLAITGFTELKEGDKKDV